MSMCMYAVIGAVIGVAVREFGTVVGVVVFGIGGLIRFRSCTDSTRDTVRLIIVTLAGLIAGLGLLHFAVMITLFAFVLIYVFDTSPPFRIRIEGIAEGRTADCAEAYRGMSEGAWLQHHRRAPFAGKGAGRIRLSPAPPQHARPAGRGVAQTLPPNCAATWIGKSASRAFKRGNCSADQPRC